MKGSAINYYAGGNTAKGFVHFFESNFQDLERLYILKGGPGTGKSTLIKSIGNKWLEKGYDLEWIHCSSDVGSLDAVIITKLKVGIVDGTAPHVIEPTLPGVKDDYVNLGIAWDRNKLVHKKEEIKKLNYEVKKMYENAYSSFSEALKRHDALEKIYINQTDFNKANQLAEQLILELLPDSSQKTDSIVKHRFLGASTPEGPVDYVEDLTKTVGKRYFIKGRAGSGKSTILKKLLNASMDKGINVEVYHCGFDPDSLDMLIFRELDFAIFDSTAPHEYFPTREGDTIIDLYDLLIKEGTDQNFAEEITKATKLYKAKMKEGISFLAETKRLRDKLESIYIEAMDFDKVNEIKNKIDSEIEMLAKSLE